MNTLRVMVQPGTAYDLLVSGALVADPSAQKRMPAARSLRQRAAAIDDGELLRTFEHIGREPFLNLLGFVHSMTDQPTATNGVDAIAAADPFELHLALLGYYRRAFRIVTPPVVIRRAIEGDGAAIKEFQRTSYPHVAHWQATLRNLLGRPASEVHSEALGAMRRWLDSGFAEIEMDIASAQASDADIVRGLVADRDLDSVLQRVAPGITFAREVGQELVVLAPSVLVRPGFALADYGSTLVIVYPAAGPVDGSDKGPPDRLVAMAKALGDDLRLRALRELRDGPMVASELAKRLGVPRTTIHHHIALLVNSGLARMSVDDARTGNIELREEAIEELGELAQAWLFGRSTTGG